VIALLLAGLAAVLFATGVVLQQRSAAQVPVDSGGTGALLKHIVRSRQWWIGKGFDVGAFVLQALALSVGSLIAVQAVLASGVVIALLMSAVLDRRWLRSGELIGVVMVAVGLVLFLGLGRPNEGDHTGTWREWVVLGALAAAALVGALWFATAHHSRRAAVLLGAVAGLLYAYAAGLVKRGVDTFTEHPWWTPGWLVAFALVGVAANIAASRAFQLAPLPVSLPMLTAVEPLCAFAIGFVMFDEHLATGPIAVIGALGGATMLIGGALRSAAAMPAASRAGNVSPGSTA
jgi:hypothetical protein